MLAHQARRFHHPFGAEPLVNPALRAFVAQDVPLR
jgi:hypothetical protein